MTLWEGNPASLCDTTPNFGTRNAITHRSLSSLHLRYTDSVRHGVASVADGVKLWHASLSSLAWSPLSCSGMLRSRECALWSDDPHAEEPL